MLLRIPNGFPQLNKLFPLPRHVTDNATHFSIGIQSRTWVSFFGVNDPQY